MGQEQVVPDLLRRVERHQKEIEDGLTNLLDLLAIWGGASEIRGEARMLRDLLNRLAGDTDRFAERIPPGKPAESLTAAQRAELDRMGGRVEQLAEQSGSLLVRAARLAAQREQSSALVQGVSAATEVLAGVMAGTAAAMPPGEPRQSALNAQANALRADAEDLRGLAALANEEAAALRKGIREAGGQTLPNELRKAANDIRDNRQSEGSVLQRSAATRLGQLADALAEKSRDEAPDLRKWSKTADELDSLASARMPFAVEPPRPRAIPTR